MKILIKHGNHGDVSEVHEKDGKFYAKILSGIYTVDKAAQNCTNIFDEKDVRPYFDTEVLPPEVIKS